MKPKDTHFKIPSPVDIQSPAWDVVERLMTPDAQDTGPMTGDVVIVTGGFYEGAYGTVIQANRGDYLINFDEPSFNKPTNYGRWIHGDYVDVL